MVTIVLNSKPVCQKRARMTRSGIIYDSQKKDKLILRHLITNQLEKCDLLKTNPLKVEMLFYNEMPPSYSEKKKQKLEGKPDVRHYDIDNVAKFYLDVMNDLVYKDDSQVCELFCKKTYARDSKVEIRIKDLDD